MKTTKTLKNTTNNKAYKKAQYWRIIDSKSFCPVCSRRTGKLVSCDTKNDPLRKKTAKKIMRNKHKINYYRLYIKDQKKRKPA